MIFGEKIFPFLTTCFERNFKKRKVELLYAMNRTMIRSKSISLPRESSDGIRICIMRKPPQDSDYDIWIKDISPSVEVLQARHSDLMTFQEHRDWFEKHVFIDQSHLIDLLVTMAEKHIITILCIEEDPFKCHRSWVMAEIKKRRPDIQQLLA